MISYLQSSKELIYLQGVQVTYTSVSEGVYNPSTGSVSNTEFSKSVKAFPKKVKTSAYNYPNLVGKVVTEFLILATDLDTPPGLQDRVTLGTAEYSVSDVSEHYGEGVLVLYKVLGVKG